MRAFVLAASLLILGFRNEAVSHNPKPERTDSEARRERACASSRCCGLLEQDPLRMIGRDDGRTATPNHAG